MGLLSAWFEPLRVGCQTAISSSLNLEVSTKSENGELTYQIPADKLVGAAMTRAIDGVVVSEEDPSSHHHVSKPGIYWMVDPIDGTTLYAYDYSGSQKPSGQWGITFAEITDGEVTKAGIAQPGQKEAFFAARGTDCFRLSGEDFDNWIDKREFNYKPFRIVVPEFTRDFPLIGSFPAYPKMSSRHLDQYCEALKMMLERNILNTPLCYR